MIDLASGTGTHALIQAERGVEVVGLDLSSSMLEVARCKAESAGHAITWVHGDMRSFDVAKPVDAVTCLYASLNHLEHPDDLVATFACVFAHLRPSGAFVFDLNTHAGFEALWRTPSTDTGPGLRIDREYEWERDGPWIAMHLRIERNHANTLDCGWETLRVRWFEDREVQTALEQAGLAVVDVTPFNLVPEMDRPAIKQLWTATRPEDA